MERQEDGPSAQRHEVRPTNENDAVNSGNVNPGVVNYEQGTPSWGQKLLDYQVRSEKRLGELESLVRNRGQSKVVPEETPAKPAHVFANKSYKIQSEFNNFALKKLKDALEADTSEDRSTFLDED